MLKDPKAAAFTQNFAGQWLSLRKIDDTAPDPSLYPEYDDVLKVAMVKEALLFFDEVLKNDLSLTNFVASDFTMLNGRLARHYGIPGVTGQEFQKVTLPPGSHRGGVLTMAGVMKVTANGTTTSPVLRGAWVLDRILGTPPPKPHDGRRGRRAGHSRGHDDPRATRQAPAAGRVRQLPREDRSARLRAGELRRHRRLARLLPQRRQGRTGGRERPHDAIQEGPGRGRRRRDAGRGEVPEHRRVQATAAEGQGPTRPGLDRKAVDLRDGRRDHEGQTSRRSRRSSRDSARRITASGRSSTRLCRARCSKRSDRSPHGA